jgi:2-haloacid dehalogenase
VKVPKALAFDVFGTVVDDRGSLLRELKALGRDKGFDYDWAAFADAWCAGYRPATDRVRRGELPWTKLDALHRMILDDLLTDAGIVSLTEEEIDHLNHAWHRLDPWPDAIEGLTRLKRIAIITTLSNGNMSLLTDMAKRAGLPWDCVLSAELFGHYKPDRQIYLGCAELLDVAPEQVMLVAAHLFDLRAAKDVGLMTAYVDRPLKYGPTMPQQEYRDGEFDIVATDFLDLAEQLAASN